jgi:hypothetical protein
MPDFALPQLSKKQRFGPLVGKIGFFSRVSKISFINRNIDAPFSKSFANLLLCAHFHDVVGRK